MASLKTCPDCGNPVSKSAPSCPKCGRVLKRPAKQYGCCGTIVVLGFAGFVGLLVFRPIVLRQPGQVAPGPQAGPPPAGSTVGWQAVAGDRVQITSPRFLEVSLCSDFDACKEYIDARKIGNVGAVEDLRKSGRAVQVPLPVAAIVEDTALSAAKVRITDGTMEGRSGWISKENIVTKPQQMEGGQGRCPGERAAPPGGYSARRTRTSTSTSFRR